MTGAEHIDGPRWECPGCIEQDRTRERLVEVARAVLKRWYVPRLVRELAELALWSQGLKP